jgi:hypothetical protein
MSTARGWDMNLTSALARVEFGSAVDMSNITAKIPQFCFSFSLQVLAFDCNYTKGLFLSG